jgi:hypothetical protein
MALWLGLVAIPVVILYLLPLRLDRQTVATGMFWEQALAAEAGRARWRRWRHKVSLAVQLVLIVAATLAAAGLQIPRPQLVVLVLDNSASMNAQDVPSTRLAAAKELAGRLTEGLHSDDRMAVLTTGGIPAVVSGPSGDAAALRAAIDSIRPTSEPSQMAGALHAAETIPLPSPGFLRRIVVLSDGCFADAAELAAKYGFEMIRFGTPVPNMAITRLTVRRTLAVPRVCEVLIETQNYSDRPADCRLVVARGAEPIDTINVSMPASGRWQQVFRMTTLAGGRLTARLEPSDAYPADNVATVDVPPLWMYHVALEPAPIQWVAADAPAMAGERPDNPLLRALCANPQVKVVDPLAPERPEDAGPSIVIRAFQGGVPEKLPRGPALVIGPSGCDLWHLGEAIADPTVARVAEDSPLLAGVWMLDVYLGGAVRLEMTEAATPRAIPFLWTADGTPLGYAIQRPEGRVVVLAGNLDEGNLAMQAALPIFVANALDWLAGQPVRGAEKPADCVGGISIDLRKAADLGVDWSEITIHRPWPPAWLWPAGLALAILVVEWCLYQRRWMT